MANYVARPKLKIAGSDASAALMEDILQISVEESLHMPGMFTIVIKNDYNTPQVAAWTHQALFEIGKEIEISFVSSTTAAPEFDDPNQGLVLKGEITAIECHFTGQSQAPIVIRGYDKGHRLHRGRYNRSFQNKTDSDIVTQIAGEAGVSGGTVDTTGGPFGYGDIDGSNGYVFQQNQTNMEFLRELAARNGFELFVQDGKLNFRQPVSGGALTLTWLTDLYSFRVRVSSSEQVGSVEVRGWDYSKKSVITSTKTTESVLTSTGAGKGSAASAKITGSPKMIVVNQHFYDTSQANKIAQGLCNELGGEFIYADARGEGNPLIRVGKIVTLTNMGDKYSGDYYITEARHLYCEGVYQTEFSVRGLRDGDLLSAFSPQARLKPGQTPLVGLVTDNKDPKKWGRVRVKLPALTEEHSSYWARIVAPGAGSARGFDCLPEINDEVLVAFENGDIHRPYVIGNVWNGTDLPPTSVDDSITETGKNKGTVRLRTFKTRLGHTWQFVDEDKDTSKIGFYLTTVYGHHLHMNDTDKFIELKTKNGFYVLLDDDQKKIAEVKTQNGNVVTLDDTNKKNEVKTSGGHLLKMEDNGQKITMTSTGDIDINSGASNKITQTAGSNTGVVSNTNIKFTVGGNSIEITNTGITLTVGGNKVELTNTSVTVQSTLTLDLKGMTVNVEGTAQTSVKGNAMVQIQGGIVQLN